MAVFPYVDFNVTACLPTSQDLPQAEFAFTCTVYERLQRPDPTGRDSRLTTDHRCSYNVQFRTTRWCRVDF